MTIDELKQQIEQRAGLPASLLKGETPEEILTAAEALLTYKQQCEEERPKSTAEQFSAWFNAVQGTEEQDTAAKALAEIADSYRMEYPQIKDGGSPYIDIRQIPDGRDPAVKFAEILNEALH